MFYEYNETNQRKVTKNADKFAVTAGNGTRPGAVHRNLSALQTENVLRSLSDLP